MPGEVAEDELELVEAGARAPAGEREAATVGVGRARVEHLLPEVGAGRPVDVGERELLRQLVEERQQAGVVVGVDEPVRARSPRSGRPAHDLACQPQRLEPLVERQVLEYRVEEQQVDLAGVGADAVEDRLRRDDLELEVVEASSAARRASPTAPSSMSSPIRRPARAATAQLTAPLPDPYSSTVLPGAGVRVEPRDEDVAGDLVPGLPVLWRVAELVLALPGRQGRPRLDR